MTTPTPCEQSISYLMRPEPFQVSRVREQARQALPAWGLAEHAELAELIISELVTNAIVHGTGLIEVGLSYEDGSLRVHVHDQGDRRPIRRHPDGDWEDGRGLALIDGLIEQYGGSRGVLGDSDRIGKTVYVTLPLSCDREGAR
ncbi:MAG TPA: ATP-binding protein [Streptosporangiaceae bacterium]|nr:ATP-binding protein [Streptosporangiaceae bacterium]